jgi:hypothetical protein
MPVLAVFSFAAPALLLGIAAAALPVLIHFLLRPKARRVRFPPVTFLAQSLASGQRAQRARDVWLLTLRSMLVGLIAILLAGPTCSRPRAAGLADAPLAAALLLDDSWSVRYSVDAGSRVLDRCVASADAVAAAAGAWPQPSTLALYFADPDRAPLEPTSDFAAVRDALSRVAAESPHAAPLGHRLREAARALAAARQPLRRLVIFTDLAAHAWRDVSPGLLANVDDLTVQVVSPFTERRSNIGIIAAAGPATIHPESASVPIAVSLAAAGIDASATLIATRGGIERARRGPLALTAGGAIDVTLNVPPSTRGTHAVELHVEPTDRLAFDQTRYVVWQSGQRPRAWLVAGSDPLDVELSATIYRNLLAPESLEPARQPFDFEWLEPPAVAARAADAASPPAAKPPDLIVVLPSVEMPDAARQAILKNVEDGAVLLLACGSRERALDWPGLRRVFSPSTPTLEAPDATGTIVWERASEFAGKIEGADELTHAAVRRRVLFDGLAEGVIVPARHSDGAPAILSKRHGRGEIYLLTTSPDPRWSDLGIRAGGLLAWLHALVARTQDSADAVRNLTLGEPLRPPLSWPPSAGTPSVQSEIAGGQLSAPLIPIDGRVESFPARQPGVYAVRAADGSITRIAANWPAEESDLRPITLERVRELLGTEHVQLSEDPARGHSSAAGRWLGGPLDPLTWWPLLLIGVVVLEMWLASRGK